MHADLALAVPVALFKDPCVTALAARAEGKQRCSLMATPDFSKAGKLLHECGLEGNLAETECMEKAIFT